MTSKKEKLNQKFEKVAKIIPTVKRTTSENPQGEIPFQNDEGFVKHKIPSNQNLVDEENIEMFGAKESVKHYLKALDILEENCDPSKQGEVPESNLLNIMDEALTKTFQLYHRSAQQTIERLKEQLEFEKKKLKEEQNKVEIMKNQLTEGGRVASNVNQQKEIDELKIELQALQKKQEHKISQDNYIYTKTKRCKDDIAQITEKLQALKEDSSSDVASKREKLLLEKISIYEDTMNLILQSYEENNENIIPTNVSSDSLDKKIVVNEKYEPQEHLKYEDIIKELKLERITNVELIGSHPSLQQMEEFCQLISKSTKLESINLTRTRIKNDGAILLSIALKSNMSIKELVLESCGLTYSGGKTILGITEFNSNLTSINLNSNILENSNFDWSRSISKCLKKNSPSLTKLNLGGNQIGKGILKIAKALRINTTIQELHLVGNDLKIEGALALFENIQENKTLKSLNLWGNIIRHESVPALTELLKTNSSLTFLNLRANNLTAKGVDILSTVFPQNQVLVSLDLTGNGIGKEGTKFINTILKQGTSLKSLYLGANNLGDEGMIHVSEGLRNNSTLKSLYLELNSIGNEGAMTLSEAFEVNTTLEKLDLNFNRIGAKGAVALKRVMPRALQSMPFRGNTFVDVVDLTNTTLSHLQNALTKVVAVTSDSQERKRRMSIDKHDLRTSSMEFIFNQKK